MRILFVYGHMFNARSWTRAQKLLHRDGIELIFAGQGELAGEDGAQPIQSGTDLTIAQIFQDLPGAKALHKALAAVPQRLGLGAEFPASFTTFSPAEAQVFSRYISQVSADNYANGIRYLANRAGFKVDFAAFQPLPLPGIFHPEAPELFASPTDYRQWRQKTGRNSGPAIALLTWHGQIAEDNHADLDALIAALEKQELCPLCVALDTMPDRTLPLEKRYPWLPLLKAAEPELLLNQLSSRLVNAGDEGVLRELDIPVIQAMRLYHQSPEEWREDHRATATTGQLIFSLAQPEMNGIIEPVALAAGLSERDPESGQMRRRSLPLEENIELLCRRIRRWLHLRRLPNTEKRLTIVLHNNPCKGVEATLGLAMGLDTFQSLADCIRALRLAGYDTGQAPEDGETLLRLFLDRKAISEFRWTTADEIKAKGGAIHLTDQREYESILAAMPARSRDRVLADWGEFPGEGMVWREKDEDFLLVTGLSFGKLTLMIQPKRGCYGAKCNGEVCRILHDPELSPPPHWLATYAYIREHSDAVVHFGAHGSLEFLPGKQVALSPACFPAVSLDDLPNIYPYILDLPSEATVAKRRGAAVLVSHLSPVRRPVPLDTDFAQVADLAGQLLRAKQHGETTRAESLAEELEPLLQDRGLQEQGKSLDEALGLLDRRLDRLRREAVAPAPHRLGQAPELADRAILLAGMLDKVGGDLPTVEELAKLDASVAPFDAAVCVLTKILQGEPDAALEASASGKRLIAWCREMDALLLDCSREIPRILHALDGGFIEAGLSASLLLGKTTALPTGRNLFPADVRGLPTRAAWEVGKRLADQLLRRYLADEGQFPDSVGVSLWSLDAFRSDGEVFCQILHLMGMQPEWKSNGEVAGIGAQVLESLVLEVEGKSLQRPRVDVLIQTSSLVRDLVPHFARLLDEAALLAGELEEPPEWNRIRKNTLDSMSALAAELDEKLPDAELRRLASFRVFSCAPGTQGGADIGLALDASAWNTAADLAEIYVNAQGYAYGAGANGRAAQSLYARALSRLDVSYQRQYSPEYDLLDSGCAASSLGGMALAAKTLGNKMGRVYWGDSNLHDSPEIRNFSDELARQAHVKLLNRNWIAAQKAETAQGYQRAGAVSGMVNTLFRWSATTGVDSQLFDKVTDCYLADQETLDWLRSQNPYALEELVRRLLEAEARGLWQTDEERLSLVREAALELEGDMEEGMGEVSGEFQGGKVEILTADAVDKWQLKWRVEKSEE